MKVQVSGFDFDGLVGSEESVDIPEILALIWALPRFPGRCRRRKSRTFSGG